MSATNDELDTALVSLDPTIADPPPPEGSERYRMIRTRALATGEGATKLRYPAETPHEAHNPPRRYRRRRFVAGIAAAAVLIGGVGIAVSSVSAPSAEAAVSQAVDAMADVTSLRGVLTRTTPDGVQRSRIEMDGDSFLITGKGTYEDGHTEEAAATVIDGTIYETIAERTTRRSFEPGEAPAPFARSSAAVIGAATNGSEVDEGRPGELMGESATRYDITMTPSTVAALAALPANQLSWFELEYPEQVESMSVWLVDGFIRQVEIDQGDATTVSRFYDLNADDIEIEAPPGPYIDPGD